MNERTRHPREHPQGGGNFNHHFAGDDAGDDRPVTVSCGPYLEQLPVGNRTVGEIRRRFGGRFDIDPASRAVLDGVVVDNDTVVRAGQALMFTRPAGEKGMTNPWRQPHPPTPPLHPLLQFMRDQGAPPARDQVHLQDDEARAVSPEGQEARMPLTEFLRRLRPEDPLHQGGLLPDGTKAVWSEKSATILVHERAPCVHAFDWIAPDSPAPFGRGATYRRVRIALPYLVILAVFTRDQAGRFHLSEQNECFFRVAPLKPGDEDLCFPALLNCSRFNPPEGRPLSWICTQHLRRSRRMQSRDPSERLWAGFDALRHCLLETAFNYSSENHEGASWFTETRGVDPRVATIEAWEQATARDPTFVLDVPWLPSGHTLTGVAQRIFQNLRLPDHAAPSLGQLARIIYNHP